MGEYLVMKKTKELNNNSIGQVNNNWIFRGYLYGHLYSLKCKYTGNHLDPILFETQNVSKNTLDEFIMLVQPLKLYGTKKYG